MKHVVIIQRRLTNYRTPMFEKLKFALAAENVQLRLLHGVGTANEQIKNDEGVLSWAEPLKTQYIMGGRLCWQPFREVTRNADLIIVTQENWLIANHLELFLPRSKRLAFWGHGGNFQRRKFTWRDRYKAWTSRQVDWWFAYTAFSQKRVAATGFPEDKITCLNNAVDNVKLAADLALAARTPRTTILDKYSISDGSIGIFIGSLYSEKRLNMLLAATKIIRQGVPDFQLIIVGTGPEESSLKAAAFGMDWVHFLGSRLGTEKAELLSVSELVLNPGLVGLGIFDAFCAGLPLLTTDCGIHSPEIAYLEDDVGLITEDNTGAFASAAISILNGSTLKKSAAIKGPQLANTLSLDRMVENFTAGILRVLEPEL